MGAPFLARLSSILWASMNPGRGASSLRVLKHRGCSYHAITALLERPHEHRHTFFEVLATQRDFGVKYRAAKGLGRLQEPVAYNAILDASVSGRMPAGVEFLDPARAWEPLS